jgi:hypothetical protein
MYCNFFKKLSELQFFFFLAAVVFIMLMWQNNVFSSVCTAFNILKNPQGQPMGSEDFVGKKNCCCQDLHMHHFYSVQNKQIHLFLPSE